MEVIVTVSQTPRTVLSEAVPGKDGEKPSKKMPTLSPNYFEEGRSSLLSLKIDFSLSNNAGSSRL